MFIRTASHTSKKRARSSVTFIIIMLIFWCTDSWTASINHLNMQLTSAPLLNNVLILIFLIITFTIEQTTMYIKRKKTTQITISFKCTDFVELNLIELMCTFFFLYFLIVQWFFFFLLLLLSFRRWCCGIFVWTIRKKYQAICENKSRQTCSIFV